MVILERQSKDKEIEKANKGKVVEYKTKETGSLHQTVTMLFSDRGLDWFASLLFIGLGTDPWGAPREYGSRRHVLEACLG